MRRFFFIFSVAFVSNLIWENLHSVLYDNYMGGKITELILLRAALIDAIIITVILSLFFLFPRFKKIDWAILLLGLIISIFIEYYALHTHRWAYNSLMPIVPFLKVGFTPAIQLGLLGYIIFKIEAIVEIFRFKNGAIWNDQNLIKILKNDGVAVMPTDTIYGIVGRANSVSTVERIYKARKRNPEKPCIILIADIGDLEKFSITLSQLARTVLANTWTLEEEPTSVVLDCPNEQFVYLHRGTKTLAFRLPAQKELQNLLKQTGPLVAPSANPEGLPPAENIAQAKKYFGDEVDLYIDGGEIKGKASKIIRLHKDGSIEILRK